MATELRTEDDLLKELRAVGSNPGATHRTMMVTANAVLRIESLQSLLREARSWVLGCYPTHQQEAEDREGMIQQIDAAAPPPPEPVWVDCEKDASCALGKGHKGRCDEIPF